MEVQLTARLCRVCSYCDGECSTAAVCTWSSAAVLAGRKLSVSVTKNTIWIESQLYLPAYSMRTRHGIDRRHCGTQVGYIWPIGLRRSW